MKYFLCSLLMLFSWWLVSGQGVGRSNRYEQYWSYNGKDILLLGGSVEDNLFQIDSLESQLDLLVACGGNYVRNTMSARDTGNVWPFYQQEDGKYDLGRFNAEYWNRFDHFLRETKARDIVVQIEIWATFDFYREPWSRNPFNPKNNINYNADRTKMSIDIPTHPVFTDNNFFRSVPSQLHITPVLWFQKMFVDKLLSYSFKYDHVLYCMDNETSVSSDWARFWAEYIHKKATLENKKVETTEMWDPHNLDHPAHYETFDYPDIFTFVDISQNNHLGGDEHWENGIKQIHYLKQMNFLRPVNNVKVYGNDGGRHQTTQNAIESFCRNVLFGAASTRFHRPTSGQGLNLIAQRVISCMREISQMDGFFSGTPDNSILSERAPNEAYARLMDHSYLVYFPDGGQVVLHLNKSIPLKIRWIDVLDQSLHDGGILDPLEGKVRLTAPGEGNWIAMIAENGS